MHNILEKKQLSSAVFLFEVHAPAVAKKAEPGQFIIFRLDEKGERVPLTVACQNAEKGTITLICQPVGASTRRLCEKQAGEHILDITGPLGRPLELGGHERACVIGGGVGCAIALPVMRGLQEKGAKVTAIAGFRSADLVMLQDEISNYCAEQFVMTDDGSAFEKGFVTQKLSELIGTGSGFDLVVAIGPLPMMKAVCELTRPFGIKTIVSLNPIMIDGTGMCGGCRVTVDGEVKFACVDGPDFDGHLVDFESLMRRNAFFKETEAAHACRLAGK